MERLNGYVMKVHGVWLASYVNCCFPTKLPDQHGAEQKERHMDLDEEYEVTQSGNAERRNSPLPISSATTAITE